MRLRAVIAALALVAGVCVPQAARAQTTPAYRTLTANISGVTQAASMLALAGQSTCVSTISGTFSGTLQFRVSNDAVHWVLATSYPDPGSGANSVQSTTGAGTWVTPVGSMADFQVYFSAYTSGVANVIITCGTGAPPPGGTVSATITGGSTITTTPSGGVTPVAGQGSAGAPTGGVLTVQGVVGGQNVNVNCATGCNSQTPWSYYVVPAAATCVTAPCVIKGSSAIFGGIINESTTSQPAGNCIWYDSAATATGNVLFIETTIGPGQVITMPAPGIAAASGIVVQCAANPSGNGILVLYR